MITLDFLLHKRRQRILNIVHSKGLTASDFSIKKHLPTISSEKIKDILLRSEELRERHNKLTNSINNLISAAKPLLD